MKRLAYKNGQFIFARVVVDVLVDAEVTTESLELLTKDWDLANIENRVRSFVTRSLISETWDDVRFTVGVESK